MKHSPTGLLLKILFGLVLMSLARSARAPGEHTLAMQEAAEHLGKKSFEGSLLGHEAAAHAAAWARHNRFTHGALLNRDGEVKDKGHDSLSILTSFRELRPPPKPSPEAPARSHHVKRTREEPEAPAGSHHVKRTPEEPEAPAGSHHVKPARSRHVKRTPKATAKQDPEISRDRNTSLDDEAALSEGDTAAEQLLDDFAKYIDSDIARIKTMLVTSIFVAVVSQLTLVTFFLGRWWYGKRGLVFPGAAAPALTFGTFFSSYYMLVMSVMAVCTVFILLFMPMFFALPQNTYDTSGQTYEKVLAFALNYTGFETPRLPRGETLASRVGGDADTAGESDDIGGILNEAAFNAATDWTIILSMVSTVMLVGLILNLAHSESHGESRADQHFDKRL